MRKALIAFLALVLVCGCGAALAAQAVSAPREEITFQEHIFSGDPAAADGLTVQLKTGMRYTFARRKRFHDDPVCRLLRRISV